jgi:hypothetical protein
VLAEADHTAQAQVVDFDDVGHFEMTFIDFP